MRAAQALAALLPLLAAVACTRTLPVEGWELAEIEIGPARGLHLTDGYGRQSALEVVREEALAQARDDGWFAARDASRRGRLEQDHGLAYLDDGSAMVEGTLYLRVDVLEWHVEESTRTETIVDDAGVASESTQVLTRAVALLSASLADATGALLLDEHHVEAHADAETAAGERVDEEALLRAAAAAAVGDLLSMITPRQVTDRVRLDDEDEAQRPILDLATSGNLDLALQRIDAYLETSPSPSALYNRAVILEAMGRYEEALESYDDALSSGGKGFYADARARCLARFEAARALGLGGA